MRDKKLYLTNNVLKVIALVTMTLDHLGIFLGDISTPIGLAFRIIGRISLPLYLFLLVEGLKYTKNKWAYLLRLGIMSIFIYVMILFINSPLLNFKGNIALDRIGNIFFELFLYALTYILATLKHKKLQILCIFPVLLIISLSLLKYLSINQLGYVRLHYLYDGFYLQYDVIGFLIFFGIIFIDKIYNLIIKKELKEDNRIVQFKKSNNYLFYRDSLISFYFVLLSILFYVIGKFNNSSTLNAYQNFGMATYLVFSIPFIILYNGKLGCHNKVLQYAYYLYYPLHLAIIFMIFYLIS